MVIGLFDSGVGGLTVARALHTLMPHVPLIYFGDSAHVPYGNKSEKAVIERSLRSSLFLKEKGVTLILVACNTSSSLALDVMKEASGLPVYGVIEPGVREALEKTTSSHIGVIGTHRTVQSHAYSHAIKALKPKVKVIEKACPLWVPLIEEGYLEGPLLAWVLQHDLTDMSSEIDTLILGCTHYVLIKKTIQTLYKHIHVVDSAHACAKSLQAVLGEETPSTLTPKPSIQITTNDKSETFTALSEQLFPDVRIEEVDVA